MTSGDFRHFPRALAVPLGGLLALMVTVALALGGWSAVPSVAAHDASKRGASVAHAAAVRGARGNAQPPAYAANSRSTLDQSPVALVIPPDPASDIQPKGAPSPQVSEAYLFDPATGKVLYAENANAQQAMASTTKIMTAYVALHFASPDKVITVGPDAVAMQTGYTSVAGLRLGDQLTLRELLYCLMLPSGDDAAVAVADGVAGSQAQFVALMNLEASLLGLGHTHYTNPHGLDEAGHYTTAHDLAVLTAYAMQSPLFQQIVAAPYDTIPATSQHKQYVLANTNDLLAITPYPGIQGVKTGYTGNAGYCLDFAAQHGSDQLIGVVLGEQMYDGRFTDAEALLNWGFGQLAPEPVASGATTAPAHATPTATPKK